MSPMSFIRSIFSSQRPAVTNVDLEAQIPSTSAESTIPPSSPSPAATHAPRSVPSASTDGTTNPLDEFFGVTRPVSLIGTHESRHDSAAELPPPYESLPAYSESRDEEPVTLAMYLFKFGFLFPPFWIVGTLILFLSLSAPTDWHSEKPENQRQELLDIMRRTEVKWSKRCAFALVLLLVVVGVALGVGFGVMRG
ncbi:hypothetical protein NEOLEDRAFT_1109686 [Neolentinus lepideus HHB14362 ss-1]|uniref:Transmembrane protein n=1 Tax=Neolentinus lepideus HHB14362 ss-1 TaxID=1314782 RepID=A0A165UHM4_9AGAM|nr:hypothetical protein NEOLEDRAFT_1109686 [Neolentinus lepideus HHB14362 ss-1]